MHTHLLVGSIVLAVLLPGLLVPGAASAQGAKEHLSGFARTVAGTTMAYTSPLSAARTALLARATDGKSSIAWETEPAVEGEGPLTFVWLAGLGSNLGEKRFTLAADGSEILSLTTAPSDSWEIAGSRGTRLAYRTLMVDRNHDRFGLMSLTLPRELIQPGKPVLLRITGEAANSAAWVMTFTFPLTDSVTAIAQPVILRENGRSVQPLDLEIINLGQPTTALLSVTGAPAESLSVPFGVTYRAVKLPPAARRETLEVQLAMGKTRTSTKVTVAPVRHRTIYLVQHAHTDIGYTRPQTEILAEHLRYIDYALDYCDQTDAYPDEAKFRWTCETSWAVREYLKTRPAEQIARLKKRVLEGRIEVTGMLLNWAEVADENALVHSLEPIKAFRELGLPVRTAMQDDVNGYAWCLVDYLHDLGIRYVSSGINVARALKPFKVPTPFWWESPSGKRVLAFRADHYMTGNFYNIHTADFELVRRELPTYLQQLEADGYPYDEISMQYSGYSTDNSPPSTFACENIRRWNTTFEWPRLRSATVHEFLQRVEEAHGKELPVYRAAWPDWWTDGFGCAVRETAADRQTQSELVVNQGLLSMAHLFGARFPALLRQQVEAVADNLLFYDEHTFGAAESISDPLAENAQVQWSEKASYVWQAVMQSRLLREATLGQLQEFLPTSSDPTIVVFNTLNWARSGLHVFYADNQVLPKERQFRILDSQGREAPAQLLQSRPEGSYWALWVSDVPPLGYAAYHVSIADAPRSAEPQAAPAGTLASAYYQVTFDTASGAIRSLYDRELGQELLDPARTRQLGEFIYERLSDRHPMEEGRLGDYTRTGLRNIRLSAGVDGPIWKSMVLSGSSDGFAGNEGIRCEVRLFKTAKRIDLLFRGRKLPVNDPEAAYVAFPFHLEQGTLLFEAQGGLVRPGVNQIPGTATDWNTVQNFAAVRSPAAQVILVSDEIPLMQFGGINTGRFTPGAQPASQQIFSWVLNNYWTTNFRSSQEGDMSWSYAITSGREAGTSYATRFGWGVRMPFVSRVLPGGRTVSSRASVRSAWPFTASSLLLVDTSPDTEGIVLHLRETAGAPAALTFAKSARGWSMEEVDALGGPLRPAGKVTFQPFETKFVRVRRQAPAGEPR